MEIKILVVLLKIKVLIYKVKKLISLNNIRTIVLILMRNYLMQICYSLVIVFKFQKLLIYSKQAHNLKKEEEVEQV